MAVANLSVNEEVLSKIGECLLQEIEAVKSLANKMINIGNGDLSEMDICVIQTLVQKAHQGAQGAYDAASACLREVQSFHAKSVKKKGRLQAEVKVKKQQLSNLRDWLQVIKSEKEEYEKNLRYAEESLRDAEQALERQREEERSMAVGRDVGIGLLFLPIIGTIAGAITIGVCESQRAEAEANCQLFSEQIRDEEEHISKCSARLQSYIARIEEKKREIERLDKNLQSTENQLEKLHELLKILGELDYQLKQGTGIVNQLLGKVDVLKFRSEKFCNVDALVIVLNDIIAHMLKLPNLLEGKVLQLEASTVEMLESLSGQLKAIESSGSDVSQWC
ncbi:uncharacterized protein [Mobula birostris]|uniref:uncharacterized protein n=1 Tax=Mobula birostris TaxID=1983395 RepID=UPI003B27F9C9